MMKFKRGLKGVLACSILSGSWLGLSSHAHGEGISRLQIMQQHQSNPFNQTVSLREVKNRQVVVKVKEGTLFKPESLNLIEMPLAEALEDRNIYIVKIPISYSYHDTVKKIEAIPGVEEVRPDILAEPYSGIKSQDPLQEKQWYLKLIEAVEARDLGKSITETVVAVIDTGVDYNHPDLFGQVLQGTNVFEGNADPMDTFGHGTVIAGIIAAGTNNGKGISGINPKAKILPIKAGDKDGLSLSDIIEGIYYAIDNGADVINMSYGSSKGDLLEYEALLEAYNKGIVLVSAAGNEGSEVNYPAAYPLVISVGSVGQDLKVTSFSNKGEQLDLVSPGTSIYSTTLNQTYDWGDGTSFSSPMVAAAASMLKGKDKTYSPAEIEYLMEKSTSKIHVRGYNPFVNPFGGYGILNLNRAMQTSLPDMTMDSGNNIEESRTMHVGQSYNDKYDLPMDEDWYRLKVSKKMRLQVEISGVRSMDVLSWFGRIENNIVVVENIVDNMGSDGKELFRFNVTPGDYYFQILERNSHWSHENYKLTFSEADTTPPPKPFVRRVKLTDSVVRGTAERGAKIIVKKGKVIIGSTIATSRSTYHIQIPVQPKNTILNVYAIDPSGNISDETQTKVRLN
jgi:cell wall-associated protease